MSKTVKIGMVGTGFVGDLHHAAFKGWVRNAEVAAVSSPNSAAKFAHERGIAKSFSDYREMLKDKEIDVIDIGIPNDLHCQVVVTKVYNHIFAGDFTKAPDFPTFADGHYEMQLCEAIERSAREKAWIKVK